MWWYPKFKQWWNIKSRAILYESCLEHLRISNKSRKNKITRRLKFRFIIIRIKRSPNK